jgi:hypothetical protein
MPIERTVRGEVVSGVDGPLVAPSGSFQDFSSYDPAITVGDVAYWDFGNTRVGRATTSVAKYILGVVDSIVNSVCRVQLAGVYTEAAAFTGDESSYAYISAVAGTLAFVDPSDANNFIIGNRPGFVGLALDANNLLLMCNGVPGELLLSAGFLGETADYTATTSVIARAKSLFLLDGEDGAAGSGAQLTLATNRGTISAAHSLATIEFAGRDAGGASATSATDAASWPVGAEIEALAEGAWSATAAPTSLSLKTRSATPATVPITRVYIDEDGLVGIGETTPNVDLHITNATATANIRLEETGGASGLITKDANGLKLTDAGKVYTNSAFEVDGGRASLLNQLNLGYDQYTLTGGGLSQAISANSIHIATATDGGGTSNWDLPTGAGTDSQFLRLVNPTANPMNVTAQGTDTVEGSGAGGTVVLLATTWVDYVSISSSPSAWTKIAGGSI